MLRLVVQLLRPQVSRVRWWIWFGATLVFVAWLAEWLWLRRTGFVWRPLVPLGFGLLVFSHLLQRRYWPLPLPPRDIKTKTRRRQCSVVLRSSTASITPTGCAGSSRLLAQGAHMKEKRAAMSPVTIPMKYSDLVATIDTASQELLGRAASVVNQALVFRNWLVGAYIVEYEQAGKDRAKYGTRLLQRLSDDLAKRGVKGCSHQMLERMRKFYRLYPQLQQPLLAEFQAARISSAVLRKLATDTELRAICSPVVSKSTEQTPAPLSPTLVLQLSWTKLIELIAIDDPLKRAFYENECLAGNWSTRQLQRQIGSLLYERTGLSKDKRAVVRRAQRQEPQESIQDILRDP